mmetsp:Transcript_757/g.1600  ORF Transcript_757/g.1600 Transcript_757/m.1600 type:complete len:215 (-) Transcript_757:165-809(-)|eukprot:CAMPEP_0178413728 /NCGR_PEP_ID=MMETSP0689_2-20121128/22676_1 /TAXON_ID=160604 /ORGANISM="Amphidinium massartii, Strain CS-259" /LENGTH=214 /DNA_ID=CAMNT_0020035007 /DNA_START=192 /DNA_END=836 /DNA_ORIENTATION=+
MAVSIVHQQAASPLLREDPFATAVEDCFTVEGAAEACDNILIGGFMLASALGGVMRGLFAHTYQVVPMAFAPLAIFYLLCAFFTAARLVGIALREIPFLGGNGSLATIAQTCLAIEVGRVVGCLLRQAREAAAALGADDADAVPNLPVVRIAATCCVCAEEFLPEASVAVLSCGHACMCASQCCRRWAANSRACPMCRAQPVQITLLMQVPEQV